MTGVFSFLTPYLLSDPHPLVEHDIAHFARYTNSADRHSIAVSKFPSNTDIGHDPRSSI
jgi:hypothetical protein